MTGQNPLDVLREKRVYIEHAQMGSEAIRQALAKYDAALAQMETLVEAVKEFVAPWGSEHYPQLREPLASFVSGSGEPQCYCGYLGWTVEKYGRETHKHGCPARTDPWCQTHPEGCPIVVSGSEGETA